MKKEILLLCLLITLFFYIVIFGIPILKIESEKIIELKSENEKFYKEITILLPAVDENGDGIIAFLKVKIKEGEGKTLLEINEISFWEDTQASIRLARSVAERVTKRDTSRYDIIYSIEANASEIEGPSAGPAMAIATSIALRNQTINNSVAITGFLREDGSIGRVSGILEKAEAAKNNKIKLLIVPKDQKIQTKIELEKICNNEGLTTFCKTEEIEKYVDVEEEIGIDIIEVKTISEALKYFVIE